MAIIKTSEQPGVSVELLRLASEIVRDGKSGEGALRTAVSRSYYAVFLTVRNRLFGADGSQLTRAVRKELERKFRQRFERYPGSHDVFLMAVTEVSAKGLRPLTLYQQLEELKEARIHADYHFTEEKLSGIPYKDWLEYADHMVAFASQIFPVAKTLPPYS
ncbi:MAG: hypothetical protein HYX90_00540 [Chloroflexi bacterium]|nr:hypothetical protein [Chloroflexota bacterium]